MEILAISDFLLGAKTKDSISVVLIVFGAFIAGARDLSYDAYGYAIVLIANLTTAFYLATISRLGNDHSLLSFSRLLIYGLIVELFVGISCFREN